MSDRIVSVLLSTPRDDALDAALWLSEQDILPRAFLTLATSFRYAVGEQWVYEAIENAREAIRDDDEDDEDDDDDDDDEKATP